MEFETKNLEVKKFIPEYINIMYQTWGTDRDVGKYMPGFRVDWDIEGFKDYIIRTYKDEYHTRAIIKEKSSNRIIGNISLYQEDSRSKSVTIWLIKECWNKGYGKEVLKYIVKELKKTDLGSIYATCDARNLGAKTILEKCEFELIDSIPNYREDIDGNIGDELLYEIELKKVQY
ncbi:MAG: GNAT family N-acetyltransferase [Erysipelotrichales bacterium]|nr:GNAT family N-acetyltransferase [Erysipelotrichales bacterium]